MKKGIGAEPEPFGNVATQSRTKIAGAGADEQGVDAGGFHRSEIAGFEKGLGGEPRCVIFKMLVQGTGVIAKGLLQIGIAKPTGFDAGIAGENFLQEIPRTPPQALHRPGLAQNFKALALGEGVRRKGGGEGLEIHQRTR